MQDTAEHPLDTATTASEQAPATAGQAPNGAEQRYDKVDLTTAAIRLGIGVDGVRRRLQRGGLEGIKEDGKWFVLLPLNNSSAPAEHVPDSVQQAAEQADRSAEQALNAAEQRYVDFLEAQNEKLWKELEERRREVSELHILLRREQEQSEMKRLPGPIDYVVPVQQTAEQSQNSAERHKKPWWKVWS